MKVEATWRGEGRLELLVTGVSPTEADKLLDSIGASVEDAVGDVLPGPVGWAIGSPACQLFPATWHRWSGRYMSDCRRWRADRATGPFRPFLGDEHTCWECEAAG